MSIALPLASNNINHDLFRRLALFVSVVMMFKYSLSPNGTQLRMQSRIYQLHEAQTQTLIANSPFHVVSRIDRIALYLDA